MPLAAEPGMIIHVVASTRPPHRPFLEHEAAEWMWTNLRRIFPRVAAAVLMPDHIHVLAVDVRPEVAKHRVTRLLAGRARVGALRAGTYSWTEVPEPRVIPNSKHLARQVRYVALNPCRDRLADDPLEWLWSTYRDVHGATVDPWITGAQLARLLWRPWGKSWAGKHHRYVSSDPDVRVEGTPLPQPASSASATAHSLDDIAEASLAATRSRPGALRLRSPARKLFLHLARELGGTDAGALARRCGVTPDAVRRHWRGEAPAPAHLLAGRLCLGDRRLRVGPVRTSVR